MQFVSLGKIKHNSAAARDFCTSVLEGTGRAPTRQAEGVRSGRLAKWRDDWVWLDADFWRSEARAEAALLGDPMCTLEALPSIISPSASPGASSSSLPLRLQHGHAMRVSISQNPRNKTQMDASGAYVFRSP